VLFAIYLYAKFGGARTLPDARAVKNVFCLCVCLSVCLFVTLLNNGIFMHDFAMMLLKYRNDFDTVG